ncbi:MULTISPECIES: zeta toxin family protein [unclassified Imperialibacter]|uniref:zeta toxin family protein n=1 Tax=unclassified Imperialibacter TaxID=2629706 RepID=UPI00125F489E|nr:MULTISPECIES: zeta toxin family protein [unclassified Imperialibacter]|tara:strand:+ start:1932 stop:2507 length:576 start_codon:yes stop_codon:yes gene_type:complete
MKKLYVIAGCNGAGKTTASYTILPEILDCREFVNADEIAKGISPFQPEKAGIVAGRLMLERIKKLLGSGESFAFETTLSTRSYVQFIDRAKQLDYQVSCLFFWLNSEELAISRVETRVKEGGHHIPEDVIRRRYKSGLKNFFNLFLPKVDNWLFVNNSGDNYEIIAEGALNEETINNVEQWGELKRKYYGN